MALTVLPRRLGYLLFFLMLFVPTHYQAIKLVLLIALLGCVVYAWTAGGLVIRPQLAAPILLYAALGMFFCFYGVLQGSPGAIKVASVFVLWPLVFLFLSAAVVTIDHVGAMVRVMVFASVAIGLYGDAYLLAARGLLPHALVTHRINQDQVYYSPTGGLVTAAFTTLAPLLFLLPFLICLLVTWPHDHPLPVRRRWVYLGIVADLVLAVLSSRRGLVLVVGVTPLLMVVMWVCTRPYGPRAKRLSVSPVVVLGVCAALTAVLFHLDIGNLANQVVVGFGAKGSADDQIRIEQAHVLWNAFGQHPILGTGLGGVTPGFVRSISQPWGYELSYLALLFHVGIVGFTLYVGALVWACASVARAARTLSGEFRRYALPVLVGVGAFLLGNASNPYLEKFDSMWVIFFPAALLNVAAGLHRQREPAGKPVG